MSFDFLDVVKTGVEIVVSVGTGLILGSYTGNAVRNSKGVAKVCAAVAAIAIEGMIADKAAAHINTQFDDIKRKVESKIDEAGKRLESGEA